MSRPRSPYRASRARPAWLPRALMLATSLCLSTTAMTASAQSPAPALQATSDGTLLSVSAQAEARRVPDIATLSAGVVTQAADAQAAMQDNASQMARLVAAIRAAGIQERDVQTSGVSVHPQYRYGDNVPPVITGYQANNTLNLKVRDISRLGKVMDALVASGANQVNGPGFDIDDKEGAYDEARRGALDKAQARARMYAEALGLRVRRIVSISEGGGFAPPMPMPMMAMAKAESMQADTPIAPGESTLTAALDVVFELGR